MKKIQLRRDAATRKLTWPMKFKYSELMKPGKSRFPVLGVITLQFGATLSSQDMFGLALPELNVAASCQDPRLHPSDSAINNRLKSATGYASACRTSALAWPVAHELIFSFPSYYD